MVTITSGETLKNKKDLVWKSLDAQREAINLLQQKPDEAAKLIADYFIAEPTLKTLEHGDVPREQVISKAIQTQTFSAALTPQDLTRMQEIADIMQAQGALKTQDGKPYDVKSIVDLDWQQARKL
jgi:NitT/TauT family transport system substrate-binding protein